MNAWFYFITGIVCGVVIDIICRRIGQILADFFGIRSDSKQHDDSTERAERVENGIDTAQDAITDTIGILERIKERKQE